MRASSSTSNFRGIIRLFARLALFLPIPLIIATINYQIDPGNIFRGKCYEEDFARFLLGGRNVTNLTNWDERLVQKYYIENLLVPNDFVVLGSSRMMQVDSEIVAPFRFFNNSISGATVEDYIAIYGLYREKSMLPSTLLLGIDPWMFNANHGQIRWKSLAPEYQRAIKKMGLPSSALLITSPLLNRPWEKYFELFSPGYLRASLRQISKVGWSDLFSDPHSYIPTSEAYAEGAVKMADGSHHYGREFRSRTPSEVREDVNLELQRGPIYSLENFRRLDPDAILCFNALVRTIQEDGVRILIFLPPYHPDTYRAMSASSNYGMVMESERFVRDFGKRNRIDVMGSYDPGQMSLTDSDFFDFMHPKLDSIHEDLRSRLLALHLGSVPRHVRSVREGKRPR